MAAFGKLTPSDFDTAERRPDRRPRVLMVTRLAPPDYSGAGHQAARLAGQLMGHGVDIRMFATTRRSWRPVTGKLPDGLPITQWPAPHLPSQPQKAMFLAGLAAHLVAHPRRYDVVHVHGAMYVLRLMRVVKPALGFQVVYKATMCGMDDARSVARWGGPAVVDRGGPLGVHRVADRGGGPQGRRRRVPDHRDLQRRRRRGFRPLAPEERRAVRASLGIADGRRVVVTVGAVVARKRQRLLVEALARMPEPRPLLLIVGPLDYDEPYAASVREAIESLGIEDAVRVLGPREDVPSLLGAGDAFAFAAPHEGSPNAVLEALAAGLPVVSTVFESVADVELLAGDRVAVVPEDPGAVARALAVTPEPGEVPAGMRGLSLEATAARYARLYDDLLAERPPDPRARSRIDPLR
jgi:glycosyltransferase involved in cell wall biosynthesis